MPYLTTWQNWSTSTASNTTMTLEMTWAGWQASTNAITYTTHVPAQPMTEEQRRESERAWLRAEEARRAVEVERQEASNRARLLLIENLNDAQRVAFNECGEFDVYVGNRRYRIRRGRTGNVERYRAGEPTRVIASYCIHPQADVPVEDVMLAQLLLLRTDEAEFRRIANVTEYRQQQRVAA